MSLSPYYQDSVVTIYHGDCREIVSKLPAVDLLLTDPPYFLPVQSYVGVRGAGYRKRMLGDLSVLSGYFEPLFNAIGGRMVSSGVYYVFCDAKSYPIFWRALFPLCKHVRLCIWDKVISYNGYTWRHQHELIAWGELAETTQIPTADGDVLRCRGVMQEDRHHPAEKPVELLGRLISKHPSASTILDPFCGSGSTLVAAKYANRKAIGVEIEERYCEVAAKRISQGVFNFGDNGADFQSTVSPRMAQEVLDLQ